MSVNSGGERSRDCWGTTADAAGVAKGRSRHDLAAAVHGLLRPRDASAAVRCERYADDLMFVIVDGGSDVDDVPARVERIARRLDVRVRVEQVERHSERGRDVFAIRESIRAHR